MQCFITFATDRISFYYTISSTEAVFIKKTVISLFFLFHNIVWEVNNITLNFSSAHISVQISIQQPTETCCGDSDCAVGTSKQVTVENQAGVGIHCV